jgi:hypothetical protein
LTSVVCDGSAFDDKVKADLESLESAISTAPLVINVVKSYRSNSEILLQALSVLHRWALEGAENRVQLVFFGAAPPLLRLLESHGTHKQILVRCLKTLAVLAEDEAGRRLLAAAGALALVAPLVTSPLVHTWEASVQDQVRDATRRLLRLILEVTPSAGQGGALDHGDVALEAMLDGLLPGDPSEETLSQLGHLGRLAPSAWFTTERYEKVLRVLGEAMRRDERVVRSAWGPRAAVLSALRVAFDVTGKPRDHELAHAMARVDSMRKLELVLQESNAAPTVSRLSVWRVAAFFGS